MLLIVALLTFVDTAYVAFFNSFYSESASLLFLLATIGGALLTIQNASTRNLALFTIAAIGLVWAKPQHAPAGLLLGLLCVRLGIGRGAPIIAALGRGGSGDHPPGRDLVIPYHAPFHPRLELRSRSAVGDSGPFAGPGRGCLVAGNRSGCGPICGHASLVARPSANRRPGAPAHVPRPDDLLKNREVLPDSSRPGSSNARSRNARRTEGSARTPRESRGSCRIPAGRTQSQI